MVFRCVQSPDMAHSGGRRCELEIDIMPRYCLELGYISWSETGAGRYFSLVINTGAPAVIQHHGESASTQNP
jgi:hypothetical protein